MHSTWRFTSTSPASTRRFGEWLGRQAYRGLVLDLRGPLGAGKTRLVRGVALGLGIREGVRSPTFTICQVHQGRLPLYHLDAYRLEDPRELLQHGWYDMLDSGVVVVEWGARIEEILPENRIRVSIDHAGESQREILVEGIGPAAGALVTSLAADFNRQDDPGQDNSVHVPLEGGEDPQDS